MFIRTNEGAYTYIVDEEGKVLVARAVRLSEELRDTYAAPEAGHFSLFFNLLHDSFVHRLDQKRNADKLGHPVFGHVFLDVFQSVTENRSYTAGEH